MDGSSLDLIIIPIVTVISLAAWLILVAYAAAHLQWERHGAVRLAACGEELSRW